MACKTLRCVPGVLFVTRAQWIRGWTPRLWSVWTGNSKSPSILGSRHVTKISIATTQYLPSLASYPPCLYCDLARLTTSKQARPAILCEKCKASWRAGRQRSIRKVATGETEIDGKGQMGTARRTRLTAGSPKLLVRGQQLISDHQLQLVPALNNGIGQQKKPQDPLSDVGLLQDAWSILQPQSL